MASKNIDKPWLYDWFVEEAKPALDKHGGEIVTDAPKYEGPYVINPSATKTQTLYTSNKVLDSNVTINKIPYIEVSNNVGTTVIIGD